MKSNKKPPPLKFTSKQNASLSDHHRMFKYRERDDLSILRKPISKIETLAFKPESPMEEDSPNCCLGIRYLFNRIMR